jgi:hypothetical protein
VAALSLLLPLYPSAPALAGCEAVVTDLAGAPVNRATVVVKPWGQPRGEWFDARLTVTDREGRFPCEGLAVGTYSVTAFRHDHLPTGAMLRVIAGGDYQLRIRLANSDERYAVGGHDRVELRYDRMPEGTLASYSETFSLLGEPPACAPLPDGIAEAYRLLRHRSLDADFFVSAAFTDDHRLRTAVKEMPRGFDADDVVHHPPREIDLEADAASGAATIDKDAVAFYRSELAHLWDLTAMFVTPPDIDGSSWTIEMRKGDECHVVIRSSDGDANWYPVLFAASRIMRFAGWKVYPDEM